MARMKAAHWQGEHGRRKMDRYDIVCIHTIVGHAPAHAAHFSTHGTGRIDQSRDTKFRSAANLEGNPRIIAIENEDHGPGFPRWSGSDVPPLTAAQVTACAEILLFAHLEHGVPLQLCPDSRKGSRGLAYHRQGIDGNFGTKQHPFPGRVPGGEVWTESRGKVCPGDRRIKQLPEILRQAKAMKLQMLAERGEDVDTNVRLFKEGVLALAKKHPIPKDREVAHDQQKQIVALAKEGPEQ
jgi:hypothetical protein